MLKRHMIAAACVLGLIGATSAAYADSLFVEVGSAPSAIETYPHTYHHGRRVYYYDDGHWYYRHGHAWRYYREEPRPLVEFRHSPRWHAYERHVVVEHPHRR
jgi:hypothetical protein